ncbi:MULTISPECIES: hypothetical protein [unclassified Pseudoalteromonas]|uniref:hypothetical protein n=1 Tax=Pseudoalteromonas TaxID=53246 RepID=UPI0010219778|nr:MULTISPECIES: hypothetical protein [unclassified Pseudoalteromonas]QLE07936.1 hypothetical protein HYD28_02515 [Pseudoalteromonas shioyasakiensis]QWV04589.1 hypothetical protein KQ246_14500 [Pseudoalteromonas shioyasakiensis]RZD21248.1 hypothetical protein EVU92_03980 [Pseudoalteromonas sp. MEBiC 03485]URQ90463.1 hypothetical protein J8Z25_00150 [Pseudoalteromonas sp. SCSIO 43101]
MKFITTLLVCIGISAALLLTYQYSVNDSANQISTINEYIYHDDIQQIAQSLLSQGKTSQSDKLEQSIVDGFDKLIQHPEYFEVKLDFYACDISQCLTQVSAPIDTTSDQLEILKAEVLFSVLAELPNSDSVATLVEGDNIMLIRVVSILD